MATSYGVDAQEFAPSGTPFAYLRMHQKNRKKEKFLSAPFRN